MQEPDNVQILLLGCGYTLERVAKSLPQGTFVATVQSEASARLLSKLGIPFRICNLKDKDSISKIFDEYPNIKILVDSVPPLPAADSKGWTMGVRNVIASLENTKLERIIYLSTTGVFGVSDGSIVYEDTDTNPDNPKSQARIDCENLYRRSGIPIVSLRIAGIYGPSRGIGLSIKQGRIPDLGPANRWTNRIHVEDLATVLTFLILVPLNHELPEIICACDDEPAPVETILEHYLNLLGIQSSLPKDSMQSVQTSQSSRSNSNQRISNSLMKSLTGLNLKYPSFREGAGTEFSKDNELE